VSEPSPLTVLINLFISSSHIPPIPFFAELDGHNFLEMKRAKRFELSELFNMTGVRLGMRPPVKN
jgi:hypothetical protein